MVLVVVLLLRLGLSKERSVDLLEDFSIDDVERHGQARGLARKRGVGDHYGDFAGVSNSGEGDV